MMFDLGSLEPFIVLLSARFYRARFFVSLGLLPYLVLVFVFLDLLLWPSFCLGLQC
jgi:hypothetical protein